MANNDFKNLAKAKQLTDDNYPYSERGVKIRSIINNTIVWLIIIFILSSTIKFAYNKFFNKPKQTVHTHLLDLDNNQVLRPKSEVEKETNNEEEIETKLESENGSFGSIDFGNNPMLSAFDEPLNMIKSTFNNIKDSISNIFSFNSFSLDMNLFYKAYIYILLTIIFIYLINVIKRSRMYERNIIKNDGLSIRYSKKIKDYLDVSSKYKLAKEQANKDNSGTSEMHKLNAIKRLKNLKLRVNTRQSEFDENIKTQFRILVDLPDYIDERNILLGEVDKLQMSATYILSGKAKFGSLIIDEENKVITWRAMRTERDPYLESDVAVDTSNELPSESSFPVDLFIDRTEIIKQRREEAMVWAKLTAETIDKILSSKQEQVTAMEIMPGNKNAVFLYELSFSVNPKQFQSYQELFDQTFKTDGSVVRIDRGRLEITIPMPKDYEIPIDMATMVKSVFG